MKKAGIILTLGFITVLLVAVGLVWSALDAQFSQGSVASILPIATDQPVTAASTSAPTPTPTPTPVALPATAQLTVPFTSQAPLAIWDDTHENTCEEASFLMVKYFLDGTALPDKNTVDSQLQDMVNWETQRVYGPSITMTQLNTVVKQEYGLTTGKVIKNITINDIKQQIAAGNPVILGMAGKLLDNPNFKDGGPNYHALVVIGYDATGFITNDPGTKNGQNFHYDYTAFYSAIHDWNPTNILDGGKDMLVFSQS